MQAAPYLTEEPLDLVALLAEVAAPRHGGVCAFLGVVREENEGLAVSSMTYEAYREMAELEMAKVAAEVTACWPMVALAMRHRIGHLELGEASVAVVAAAPHRVEAFAACRFAIDTLKRTVPIWKHEHGETGSRWVEGR